MPDPSARRFPAPWTVTRTTAGYRVDDANGIALAYVYGEPRWLVADQRLNEDEARRIAVGIARLPELLGRG